MELVFIYVVIAVIAIFLFNIIFKPKFECPECKTIHTKGDAKSQKATVVTYAHTRKDGGRDRRFNQSGTQHYDLTFECKSCGKEFVKGWSGIFNYLDEQRRSAWAKQMLKDDPKLEKNLRKLDDIAKNMILEMDVKSGEKKCPKCGKTEVGHIVEDCA